MSGAERRLTLVDVIESGRLLAGGWIEKDYMDKHFRAKLLADGQIRFQGKTYGSLSGAAVAVKQAVLGQHIPTDGWLFWLGRDASAGDTVTLKVIRQRVAADLPRD